MHIQIQRVFSLITAASIVGLSACSSTGAPSEPSSNEVASATSCTHPICATGSTLTSTCDACVAKICRVDSYCCRTSWDATCVGEVASVCNQSCSVPGGHDAGATGCAHGVCATGGKLDSACDPCASTVCGSDPYCCATSWDSQCVGEAKSMCTNACGAPPPPPPPPPPPVDAGTGPGSIGVNGGSLAQLAFGIVGDTRPATIDDTAGYPTDVITQIYTGLAQRADSPPFVVSTGDYNFATPTGNESATQFDLYMNARAKYAGAWFPTMGNHECTGYTSSNCGQGNQDGVTQNYANYLSQLLGPIQKTLPYYTIQVNAVNGTWTSKFVFVAANAWDTAQASWLQTVMAKPTTYTFIVRHEAAKVTSAPGVSPSEKIINSHPYTLEIVGHSHTYSHSGQEVLVGNGGAPLTGSSNFGYSIVKQRSSDNALVVDMYDYQSGAPDAAFHFAVNADGSAAAP